MSDANAMVHVVVHLSWFKPLKSTKQIWGVGGRVGGGGQGPDTDTHP